MSGRKKNSFRCFAIYKIGLNGEDGQFTITHKRGCLKTFNNEEKDLIEEVNQHFDGQQKNSSQSQFKFKNWIGIKEQKKDHTYYLLLLLHQNGRKEDAFKQLETFQKWNEKNENYKNIDPNELEYQIYRLEQKYGEPDGFETDEGQDEIIRNQQSQIQQQSQQLQQQQQQQQQQQLHQQQQQQKKQQQQQQQQSNIQQQQQQQQFQSPQKNSQLRQSSAQKTKSPKNKVLNANYNQIYTIIDKTKDLKPTIQANGIIAVKQESVIQQPSYQQQNKEIPINDQEPKQQPKKRQKQQFSNQEARQQMDESNKLKQADALIRNSIVGALTSGTLALIL